MEANMILAKKGEVESVQRCCHGVVHVHYNNISLRFAEGNFFKFASMLREASARLMDKNLSDLLNSPMN